MHEMSHRVSFPESLVLIIIDKNLLSATLI